MPRRAGDDRNVVKEGAPADAVQSPALGERLVGVKELAGLLGVSTRWIHERTRYHEIPCYRFGTAIRFAPEEIRPWLAQYRDTPEGGVGR